jgi:hypothetical protein
VSAYPTQTQFAEQVGTVFSAGADGAGVEDAPTVEFTLTAVTPGIVSENYAPYTLEFSGPLAPASSTPWPDGIAPDSAAQGTPLPQATYLLAHPALGEYPIFLVPVAVDGATVQYEAVFNVAKESEG